MKTVILPILTAAGTADWVFGSILAVLTLVLILLSIIALRRRAARRKAAAPVFPGAAAPYAPHAAAVYPPEARAAETRPPVPPAVPEERRESLMGSLIRPEAPAAPEPAQAPAPADRPMDEKSIDKHFADHHGQWICRYCETINDQGLVLCQACGQPRN